MSEIKITELNKIYILLCKHFVQLDVSENTYFDKGFIQNTWSDTKKKETNPIALEPRVGGSNKYTAMEHDLSCHSVTSFSSIASLSTS
jgi:hypothetical protein